MNATPEQLAALAKLVGVTPETHPHLVTGWCDCGEHGCPNPAKFDIPALDTPAGDDVFLAPLMRWLHENTRLPTLDSQVADNCDPFPSAQVRGKEGFSQEYGETFIIALLRACQSAGVPEIVAIFGEIEK